MGRRLAVPLFTAEFEWQSQCSKVSLRIEKIAKSLYTGIILSGVTVENIYRLSFVEICYPQGGHICLCLVIQRTERSQSKSHIRLHIILQTLTVVTFDCYIGYNPMLWHVLSYRFRMPFPALGRINTSSFNSRNVRVLCARGLLEAAFTQIISVLSKKCAR